LRIRLLPSLIALAAALPAIRAGAADDGDFGSDAQTIALLPLGSDDRARGEQMALLALLAEELEQRSDLLVLKPSDVRAAFDGSKPPDPELRARIEAVQGLLDQARKHYQFLEVDKAQQKLDSAQSRVSEVREQLTSPQLLVELSLLQALVALVRGERAEAVDSFGQACSVDPAFEITEEEYPPDVVEAFREGRERVAGASKGVLDLTSSPEICQVFIDGVRRGRTPLRLELPPGEHLVRLQRRGCRAAAVEVAIKPGKTVERRIVLDLRWDEDQLDELDVTGDPTSATVEVRRDLAGFARRLGAEFLLLAARNTEDQGSRAWLFSAEGARFWTRSWAFSGGGMFDEGELAHASRDVAMALVAGLPADDKPEREPLVEREPGPGAGFGPTADGVEEDREWYRTWWFWTIVGGVVVGAAAGVTAGVLTQDDPKQTATILVEEKP